MFNKVLTYLWTWTESGSGSRSRLFSPNTEPNIIDKTERLMIKEIVTVNLTGIND